MKPIEAGEYGIIIFDLMGGDAVHHFVDRERWNQISKLVSKDVHDGSNRLNELVLWICGEDEEEDDHPEGYPDRKGRLLASIYTQTYVPEKANIQGALIGMLTFPGM